MSAFRLASPGSRRQRGGRAAKSLTPRGCSTSTTRCAAGTAKRAGRPRRRSAALGLRAPGGRCGERAMHSVVVLGGGVLASADASLRLDCGVLVEEARVAAVGSNAALLARAPGAEVVDARGLVLLPGF